VHLMRNAVMDATPRAASPVHKIDWIETSMQCTQSTVSKKGGVAVGVRMVGQRRDVHGVYQRGQRETT
jgi:hypothetical protein